MDLNYEMDFMDKGYNDFVDIQAKSFQVVLLVQQPTKKQESVVLQDKSSEVWWDLDLCAAN